MPRIKVAIGVSPRNAAHYDEAVEDELRQAAEGKLVCAIGSCGLNEAANDVQRNAFARQIRLARELGFSLVVEAEGAYDEAHELMAAQEFPFDKVLLRAFAGTSDQLASWVDSGCYVSFDVRAANDPVTFFALAKQVPVNRLFVESGAPDFSSDALAGYPPRPDQVVFAADAIRSLCTAPQLFTNALDFFGL